MVWSLLMAFIAGNVTILSPCVLPLLPIVLGSALTAHRWGPMALAAGLVLAFTATGFLIATFGIALGLSPDVFSKIAATIMIVLGLVLVSAELQTRFALVAGRATKWLSEGTSRFAPHGLGGQFAIGVLLGAVWTPCVGPTLGAAVALAAQGQDLGYAASVMLIFGLGVVTPLLLLTLGARELLAQRKATMAKLSTFIKPVLGGLLVLVGMAIVTETMTDWEAIVLAASPQWLIQFIYSF